MDAALKQKLIQIKKLITSNQYKDALDECEVMIYKHSKVYQLYLFAGLCYDKLGSLDKAQNSYKQALDIKPEQPNAIKALCDLYTKMGEDQKSVEFIEKIMKLLNKENKEELIKYRQWMAKLVKIYQKNEDMEKIDVLFKELVQTQSEITEQFAQVAEAYFKTGVTNQCFYLDNFVLMGFTVSTNTYKSLSPSAKQRLNYVLVEIVRYLNSVRLQFKMQLRDISNSIYQMKQYFPHNSCFLMLLLLDQFSVSSADFSTIILQEIYQFLQAIYNKKEAANNCYLNIELLQPEMFAICMKLGFEYLGFLKEFFTLDACFNTFYEQFENDAKQTSLLKVREQYVSKITNFILKECREISRISETQNVDFRLDKLKSRILKLDGSYLEEVMAKMAMNSFVNYQKLNDMKNLLKTRLKNSRRKEGLEKNEQEGEKNEEKMMEEKQEGVPQPHLYKYYYDYLLKIGGIYRVLDEEYSVYQILDYITKHDPNDYKYQLQKIWVTFSRNAQTEGNKNIEQTKQALHGIITMQPQVFGVLKSTLLRRKTLLNIYLNEQQSILDGLKLSLGTDRSFENLLNMGTYYFAEKNYQRALNFLKEAFVMKQTHYHLNRIIFISLLKIDQKNEAFTFLERIYEGFPNVFWINYSLAIYNINRKKFESANRYLNKALQGFVAGTNKIYNLSYEKTLQKQLSANKNENFTLQYMIHQNQSRILFDEIVMTEQQINTVYPLASNKYFQTDQSLKQVRIETQLGENYKLLGRNKSAYNHLYSAYSLIQNTISLLEDELKSKYLLQQIITGKQFAAAIFYMKFYNEAESILYRTLQLLYHYQDLLSENKQFIHSLISECEALGFQISVKKLEQLMKFQSYEAVKEYINKIEKSQLLERANKKKEKELKSLNFLKSKYQYEIMLYLHKKTGEKKEMENSEEKGVRCFEAMNEFLAYFKVSIKDVGTDTFYNTIVQLNQKDREILMQGLEDYCLISIIFSKCQTSESLITTDFVIKLIQVFPKSTIFYIVYGVLTDCNKKKIAAFLKCIQMDKDSPVSVDLLACLYLKYSDYVTACNLFLKALEIDLFSPKSYIGLCTCLFSLVIQSISDYKSDEPHSLEQQELIHKCLNKIKSYMQFLKIVQPSENYQLFRFLKILVTDEAVDVFSIKASLQHIHRSLSVKFKNTLLYQMLGQISWWSTQNIWSTKTVDQKKNAMQHIIQNYFEKQSLINENTKGEQQISKQILTRVHKQIQSDQVNKIANSQIRVKLKCRMLNQLLIAINLFVKSQQIDDTDLMIVTEILEQIDENEGNVDDELRNLQKKSKQSLLHCLVLSSVKPNQQIDQALFSKLKALNTKQVFKNLPTYEHVHTLLVQMRRCLSPTANNTETYQTNLQRIKKYVIYSLHLHPTDLNLRKTLYSYLMSIEKINNYNLKHIKNNSYRIDNLAAIHNEKNGYECSSLARLHKKNAILNRDPQSWVAYIDVMWNDPKKSKQQLSCRWLKTLLKILVDIQSGREYVTPNCFIKCKTLINQMQLMSESDQNLTPYQKVLKNIEKIQNDGSQLDLSQIKLLNTEQQSSALVHLCSMIQHKYESSSQLLTLYNKIEQLFIENSNKKFRGYFKLLKFLATIQICQQLSSQQSNSSQQQFLDHIKSLYLLIQSQAQEKTIHPNALAYMKCMLSILTMNYENLESELNQAMDSLKFVTENDQFLINYFEILRAYKEVQNQGQGEGSYENFEIYIDEMIKSVKEPLYKGFFYMLKAMARIIVQGDEEIDSKGLKEIKMAKLLDPRAAKHLFNQ